MEAENMADPVVLTSVKLSPRLFALLRALAAQRALETGAKPNATAVIADLIDREGARAARRGTSKAKHDA
jgi:hypothetical protein